MTNPPDFNSASQTVSSAPRPTPDAPGAGVLGHARAFFRDRLDLLERACESGEEVSRVRLGPLAMLVLNTPERIGELLVERAEDFGKGDMQRRVAGPLLGLPLNSMEGDAHRKERQRQAPMLQARQIAGYADGIVSVVQKRIEAGWQDGAQVELSRALTTITIPSAAGVMFGWHDLQSCDPLWKGVETLTRLLDIRNSNPLALPLSWPLPGNIKAKHILAAMNQRLDTLIASRQAIAAGVNPKPRNDETANLQDAEELPDDILTLLITTPYADGSLPDTAMIRDQTRIGFLAAADNTATALMWCLCLLARHPEVYDLLQAEVDAVLGARAATIEDVPRLEYAGCVLKESMRLYPLAPLLARQASRDTRLGAHSVKSGTVVLFAPWAIHRRADAFPDPLRFWPERFAPETQRATPRFAYLPFGAGSRACIGGHLAHLMMTLTLATLTQKLRVTPAGEAFPVPVSRSLLRARNGAWVQVHRRR